MRKKANNRLRFSLTGRVPVFILCTVLLATLFSSVAAAADYMTVYVSSGGKTVKAATYSEAGFKAIGTEQQHYSSLNSEGAPVTIIAEGVTVNRLLESLLIPAADVEELAFSATDGWSRKYDAGKFLNTSRYYYGGIVSGYDVAASESFGSPEFIEGTENDRQAVPPMLAISFYEGRFEEKPVADKLQVEGALRFCHGQAEITDTVMLSFGKNINSLTVTIKTGSGYVLPDGEAVGTDGVSGVPVGGLPEKLDTIGLKADTLTITVGYYGGTYYTKKVFTYEEMIEMSTVQQVYSYIDNMPAVCLTAAIGVPITRILEEAGVDVNSVQSFNFFCADVAKTWYTSMTKTQLLGTPRFYYPNLPKRWDYDEMRSLPLATADAMEVEAILAVTDKWRRFATELDFTDMTETTRYRLVFGQADVFAPEASKSAKWVHTIAVTLGGAPPKGVTTDYSVLDGKVGSLYTIGASVEKTDETTDTRVTWSSSDESVATVDRHGNVTIVGEGEAVITVTTVIGGLTTEIIVRGAGAAEEESPADNTTTPVITDAEIDVSPDKVIVSPNQPEPAATLFPDGALQAGADIYRVVLGGTMPVTDGISESAAVQSWRSDQMAPDATALPELDTDETTLWQTALALVVLFFASIAARIVKYRTEINDG